GVYQLLTTRDSVTLDEADHLIWHPQVPLKVSIFAWRLLRDRFQYYSGPLRSLHIIIRWISGTSVFFAAYMACQRMGHMDGKKPQIV
ncbi:cysteine-rich receptor-like protein kinase, partial [Trifolium pratense]